MADAHSMRMSLDVTTRMALRTGWSAEPGLDVLVIKHAVEGSLVDRHVAVCGSALPVVDRRRPWFADTNVCCEHCLDRLTRSAS